MNLKIRPGEKSIPAIMKNHYGMSHMFDITQLINKPKIKNWFVDDKERDEFEQNFIRKNQKHTMIRRW